ncbi:hypothetical protein FQN57_000419 [Myotisia sp. PD_48]|nr:hypothetical protein FQN57_000419 [Myotisia sp. PD_48]
MHPIALLGVFSFFTLYGLWFPIPFTAINPYTRFPARIAGSLQLTASTNVVASVVSKIARRTINSTHNDDAILRNGDSSLDSPIEDILSKWEREAEYSSTTTTLMSTETNTPILSTTAQSAWPDYYASGYITDPEQTEWIFYILYESLKQEAKRYPNMYTFLVVVVSLNVWALRSICHHNLNQSASVASRLPASSREDEDRNIRPAQLQQSNSTSPNEGFMSKFFALEQQVQDISNSVTNWPLELAPGAVENITAQIANLQVRVEELASTTANLQQNRHERSPSTSPSFESLKNEARQLTEKQGYSATVSVSLRKEFENLQTQVSDLKTSSASLEKNSRNRSESTAALIEQVMELRASSENANNQNLREDLIVLQAAVVEIESQLKSLQQRPLEATGLCDHAALDASRESELEELSTRLQQTEDMLQRKPWNELESSLSGRLEKFAMQVERLEKLSAKKLEATKTQSDWLKQSFETFKGEGAKQHKQLSSTVQELVVKTDMMKVDESSASKTKELIKDVKILSKTILDTKNCITTLVSEDIPRQREQDRNHVTELIDELAKSEERHRAQIEDGFNSKISQSLQQVEDLRVGAKIQDEQSQKMLTSIGSLEQLKPDFETLGDKVGSCTASLQGLKDRLEEMDKQQASRQGSTEIGPKDFDKLKKRASEIETYAYRLANDLERQTGRIDTSDVDISAARYIAEGLSNEVGRCMEKLGLERDVAIRKREREARQKPSTSLTPRSPVIIDLSVGKNATPETMAAQQGSRKSSLSSTKLNPTASTFAPSPKEKGESLFSRASPSISTPTRGNSQVMTKMPKDDKGKEKAHPLGEPSKYISTPIEGHGKEKEPNDPADVQLPSSPIAKMEGTSPSPKGLGLGLQASKWAHEVEEAVEEDKSEKVKGKEHDNSKPVKSKGSGLDSDSRRDKKLYTSKHAH